MSKEPRTSLKAERKLAVLAKSGAANRLNRETVSAFRLRLARIAYEVLPSVELALQGKEVWSASRVQLFKLLLDRLVPTISEADLREAEAAELQTLSRADLEALASRSVGESHAGAGVRGRMGAGVGAHSPARSGAEGDPLHPSETEQSEIESLTSGRVTVEVDLSEHSLDEESYELPSEHLEELFKRDESELPTFDMRTGPGRPYLLKEYHPVRVTKALNPEKTHYPAHIWDRRHPRCFPDPWGIPPLDATVKAIDPYGYLFYISNVDEWCAERGFNSGNLVHVVNGHRGSTYRFTFERLPLFDRVYNGDGRSIVEKLEEVRREHSESGGVSSEGP